MGSRWWPRIVVLAGVLVCGGVIAFGVLDTGDKIASVVSCLVSVAILAINGFDATRRTALDDDVETDYLNKLSAASMEQWRRETSTRGLLFPEPLRVPWTSVDGPFTADPDVVLGRLAGARRTALRLKGDVTTLADTVAALPARQVVIIGEPGSGKTSAALLLAQRLTQEGKVPVWLDLAGWDAEGRLEDWIADQLTSVRATSLRPNEARLAAAQLVEHEAVVPIFDGFDELPGPSMERVIEAVHTWDRPFVLAVGAHEYETAVRNTGLTVARALVVQLAPLPVPEISAHLTAGRADSRRRWAPVMGRLASPGPLRDILSSPLTCSIVRKADGHIDPAELVTFDNAEDLEAHILGRAYPTELLKALARLMARRETRRLDLSVTSIPTHWPKSVRIVLSTLVIVTCLALTVLLTRVGWAGTFMDRFAILLGWMGVAFGFMTIHLATRRGISTPTPFRIRVGLRKMLGTATAFAVSATVVLVVSIANSSHSFDTNLALGILLIALLIALVGTVSWGSLTEPVTRGDMSHPLTVIHQDGWALATHFPAPVLGAAVYSAITQNFSALPLFAVLFLIISTSIPDQVPGAAWSRWMLQRLRLFRQGLPPEWSDNLEHTREQGILRAVGTSYRFEHRRIQDHLAQSPQAANKSLVTYQLLRPSRRLKRRPEQDESSATPSRR